MTDRVRHGGLLLFLRHRFVEAVHLIGDGSTGVRMYLNVIPQVDLVSNRVVRYRSLGEALGEMSSLPRVLEGAKFTGDVQLITGGRLNPVTSEYLFTGGSSRRLRNIGDLPPEVKVSIAELGITSEEELLRMPLEGLLRLASRHLREFEELASIFLSKVAGSV